MAPIRTSKLRRGPKPKPIGERILRERDLNPIVRPKRTYNQKHRIRVLIFLEHYRIPLPEPGKLRPPTQQEASKRYKIPQRTISEWVKKKNLIEEGGSKAPAREVGNDLALDSRCWWPELEEAIYKEFIKWREEGRLIRRGWFRVQAGFHFRELYPDLDPTMFRFSNGWFSKFLGRHRISLRCITKKAQRLPAEYQSLVLNWLRFNRRNSQPKNTPFLELVLQTPANRFSESNICNLDETPIPFEYLEGKTYDPIGAKTVWAKSSQNGWDKRQASLVLCVFADGIPRIPPMIIFRGKGERLGREREKYHPGVEVEFNPKAYMNDQLFLQYIEQHLIPALGGRPSLFAIDLMGSHKTPAVLEKLRAHNILPSLIPGGCTSLLQPLDVAINKPFKEMIRELTDTAIFEAEDANTFHQWTVSDRRILTTTCVGDAFYQFHLTKSEIIRRVFRQVGLSLPVDGTSDSELKIKGFPEVEVGDWHRDYEEVEEEAELEIPETNDDDSSIEFVHSNE